MFRSQWLKSYKLRIYELGDFKVRWEKKYGLSGYGVLVMGSIKILEDLWIRVFRC